MAQVDLRLTSNGADPGFASTSERPRTALPTVDHTSRWECQHPVQQGKGCCEEGYNHRLGVLAGTDLTCRASIRIHYAGIFPGCPWAAFTDAPSHWGPCGRHCPPLAMEECSHRASRHLISMTTGILWDQLQGSFEKPDLVLEGPWHL